MEQPNECAVKRAVGPATCLGGGQGDRPHPGHLPANLAHTLLVALPRLADDIAHREGRAHDALTLHVGAKDGAAVKRRGLNVHAGRITPAPMWKLPQGKRGHLSL
jgi:hypothetical protein